MLHMSFFSKTILLIFLALPGVLSAEVTAADVIARRAGLERELVVLEKEIEAQRQILTSKQRESISLERDIAIFDAKIQSAELSIRARKLIIQRLSTDISGKRNTISDLSSKIERERDSIARLLRQTNKLDSFSLVEVVFSNENLSEFFRDLESFTAIKAALKKSVSVLEGTKQNTKQQKIVLEGKQIEQEELKHIQELQKTSIEVNKLKKKRIHTVTKGEEARYLSIVREKNKNAAAIRSALFNLRGSSAISFEEALEFANRASEKTGVRAALILGVISQESRLGENIGQCTYNQIVQGKPVMHPERDTPIFIEIVQSLGLDPGSQPVSCVWIRNGKRYGWGGAMGPAQFIPSTWMLIRNDLTALLSHAPNPWIPRDAFMASAVLLRDNQAANGTYKSERLAALRYFAGWRNATKSAYAFYGNQVMERTAEYQMQIDILKRN